MDVTLLLESRSLSDLISSQGTLLKRLEQEVKSEVGTNSWHTQSWPLGLSSHPVCVISQNEFSWLGFLLCKSGKYWTEKFLTKIASISSFVTGEAL